MKTICDDNGDTDVNYTYDLNNRLLEESTNYYSKNEIDVTKYVYDNNGNQIKKIGYITKGVNGSPSQDLVSENELNNTYEIYKYNEFNEMTSFESNKESKWEYAYLPNGLRYRKSNASHFDRYVWDRNGNIIAEMNGEGNLTSKYVRGNKLISKDGNEYYGYDGHGSVVNISNEDGKSIKNYDYDAFGVELNKDVNDTNLFRYCGEQYDNETDSIYLRARYYSPSLGRFTTEDPVKDGDNWYSYCAGNPVNGWDPSGNTRIENGVDLDAREFGEDSLTYRALSVLTASYKMATVQSEKNVIHDLANLCREIGRTFGSSIALTIPEKGPKDSKMNPVERMIAKKYPLYIVKAFQSYKYAMNEARERYGDESIMHNGIDDERDAFRHALYAAYLTYKTGKSLRHIG